MTFKSFLLAGAALTVMGTPAFAAWTHRPVAVSTAGAPLPRSDAVQTFPLGVR